MTVLPPAPPEKYVPRSQADVWHSLRNQTVTRAIIAAITVVFRPQILAMCRRNPDGSVKVEDVTPAFYLMLVAFAFALKRIDDRRIRAAL